MSTSTKPYHHGDLRKTLLEVADQLIDEGDAGAFSLREVARRAGVSPPATYRHFGDKQALLAAVAQKGFEDFGRALSEAIGAADDPLAAMGQAYVRFAVARPGRFRLMYGPAIVERARHPELQTAWIAASEAMRAALLARSPSASDAAVTSLKLWCMVHGLSQLILDGMLPGHDPDVLARAITAAS
ncbi:TetR/AcrR family transcriptional regulator [Massilia pseudoviolaceinigra]|uniref:TetR/AcrR family transcriptional regulator n=1 Tax=Massilia pseudoviolaceinigra TaxID=3057165 RepID=UPI002796B663|nr:TetR/AcrR family transcriptional regulator [Massilia sp. CCM 9206]MDQ1921243.1 TetR/AcrR family transcriptional regulator [Massilia sp. CCM 9206]